MRLAETTVRPEARRCRARASAADATADRREHDAAQRGRRRAAGDPLRRRPRWRTRTAALAHHPASSPSPTGSTASTRLSAVSSSEERPCSTSTWRSPRRRTSSATAASATTSQDSPAARTRTAATPWSAARSPARISATIAGSPVESVTGLFPRCWTCSLRSEDGSFSSSRSDVGGVVEPDEVRDPRGVRAGRDVPGHERELVHARPPGPGRCRCPRPAAAAAASSGTTWSGQPGSWSVSRPQRPVRSSGAPSVSVT